MSVVLHSVLFLTSLLSHLLGKALFPQSEWTPIEAEHLHPQQPLGRLSKWAWIHGWCESTLFICLVSETKKIVTVLLHFMYLFLVGNFNTSKQQLEKPNMKMTSLLSGEEAAHRPLCQLPGWGAEGCGPWAGAQTHLFHLCQRGAQLSHAACTGHAWNR